MAEPELDEFEGAVAASEIRSLFIPLHGFRLVLPNAAVAEVVAFSEPVHLDAAPEWLLGLLDWRGQLVPLASLELAMGAKAAPGGRGPRVAVLNALGGRTELPFLAIVLQGIPSLVRVGEADIADLDGDEGLPGQLVLRQVWVHGQPTVIPDLLALEEMVAPLF